MADEPKGVVPRGRRWPWVLGAALVSIALLAAAGYLHNLHWQRKVDALLASYRAKGQPVTWEEVLAARDTLPADQNSALVFQDALAEIEGSGDSSGDLVDCLLEAGEPGARPSEQTLKLLRAHLTGQARALVIIRRGAALPGGVYPLQPTADPSAQPLPYLPPLWAAVGLCCRNAELQALEGDARGAAGSLLAARRLCASLGDCWIMAEARTRIGCEARTVRGLEATLGLCQLTAGGLSGLREELTKEESKVTTEHAWMTERAMGYHFFNRTSTNVVLMYYRSWGRRTQIHLLSYQFFPFVKNRDAVAYYGVVDRYAKASDLPVEELVARFGEPLRTATVGMWYNGAPYWRPEYLVPDFDAYLKRWAQGKAGIRVAVVALAAEQWRTEHGRWPESLDDLVPEVLKIVPADPFGTGPLRYVRTKDGARVYSVGPDGKDDGGLTNGELEAAGVSATGYLQNLISSPRMSITPAYEGGDISFRLLNPDLRGARQMTFPEEVRAGQLSRGALDSLGFTPQALEALGVREEDYARP